MSRSFLEKIMRELSRSSNGGYGDARVFSTMDETNVLKNGNIEEANTLLQKGFNVRVIHKGAWGYASSSNLNEDRIPIIVKQAFKVAKASSQKLRKSVVLTEEPIITDKYITPFTLDPFEVDMEEKLELLGAADSAMKDASEQIKVRVSGLTASRKRLFFGNTEGSLIEQQQTYSGCQVRATAIGTEVQSRSSGDFQMRGFEFAREFEWSEEAMRVANDALILANEAENCPKERTTFILEPFQLGLTIHESTGHPTELDRVMGFEADFAGTSFLTLDKLGQNYKYGSELVNIICDPQTPDVLGHYKYDDEGVETKRFPVIEKGIFKNYMTDRETAHEIGLEHSLGNSRIANYNRIPLVRMSHLYLEPDPNGPRDVEEMIEETENGIYGLSWKSHSIDDKRINFQFSTQIGWLIENGELTKPLKNVCYNAKTPEFWGECDMITREDKYYGTPNCGKGVPMQVMWVSHGGGWARFQNVNLFAG
ncbi:MAG: TldD/PmbA family protein [Candidatus Heimdallarchaeota archaeon]